MHAAGGMDPVSGYAWDERLVTLNLRNGGLEALAARALLAAYRRMWLRVPSLPFAVVARAPYESAIPRRSLRTP